MEWLPAAAVVAFFLVLLGQYAYREARRENRSSPAFRGVLWWLLGIVGAVRYLARVREREKTPLAWLALSVLLFALWAVGTFGLWGLSGGFYLWAGLFAGLFVLYWQFDLESHWVSPR